MNEKLKKRIENIESRVQELEDANILYGEKIEDSSYISGFWYKKAELNKVIEKLLDHLGVTFSTSPATEESIILIDKKTLLKSYRKVDA